MCSVTRSKLPLSFSYKQDPGCNWAHCSTYPRVVLGFCCCWWTHPGAAGGWPLTPGPKRLPGKAGSPPNPAWSHTRSPPPSANLPRNKPGSAGKPQLLTIPSCWKPCGQGARCDWAPRSPAGLNVRGLKPITPGEGSALAPGREQCLSVGRLCYEPGVNLRWLERAGEG